MKKLALLTAVLLLSGLASCGALALMLGGAGMDQAAACAPATIVAVSVPIAAEGAGTTSPKLPATIGRYKGEQITNAGHIVVAARNLRLDAQAQTIGVMTAIGESSLTNLDRGDQAGPDSRGLFQQRANGAWGTYEDRMNPRTAATHFFQALMKVPGWQSMAPTLAAHSVQRNADPYHYQPFWTDAVQIVSILSGDPDLASKLPASGAAPCAPNQGHPITGAGGAYPPETCNQPDPTRAGGCLTPRMLNIATQLRSQGWSISCWDAHAWNPTSDHPLGRACDIFPGKGGQLPTAAQKANGDALTATLQATAAATGINYLIWYGQIWSTDHAAQGWRPYGGGGVYDPSDITGGHYDHVHVSAY